MSVETIELWLRTSVIGIILLGVIGSIISVVLWKLIKYLITDVVPIPYLAHRKGRFRQAYLLGFAAAAFEQDEKGHHSTIFLAFRLSRLLVSLFLFISLLLMFSLAVVLSPEIVVTFGTLAIIIPCFISLYWAYTEYEFIRLTYKSFWQHAEKMAHEYKVESDDNESR